MFNSLSHRIGERVMSGWERFVTLDRKEPGFLPYVLALRQLAVLGSLLFIWLHTAHGSSRVLSFAGAAILFVTAVAALVTSRGKRKATSRWQYIIIAADIVGISMLYVSSNDAQTDLYLLFGLPLLTATAQFGGPAGFATLVVICVAYFCSCAYLEGCRSVFCDSW